MFDPDSPIRVRILHAGKPQTIDSAWWQSRLEQALAPEPKPDADQNLAVQLLKVIDASIGKEYEEKLRAGGLGYGDLKKKLFEVYWEYFAAARAKRAELVANLDFVHGVLKEGATKARAVAQNVLHRARKESGLA